MIDLALVGIGTGNPDHLTREAIAALNAADLILLPDKGAGKRDLIDTRRAILAQVLVGPVQVVDFDLPRRDASLPYLQAVALWHDAIAALWRDLIARHLPQGGRVALMVWGDPMLYDSSLRLAGRLGQDIPLRVTVVPGITSLQVLCAAHAIPLNALGAPVLVTTGRNLRDGGWPEGQGRVAVMLDAGGAFEVLEPARFHIWWGAYLGLPQQALVAGPLAKAGPQIVDLRAELRARHGWIMDIYLLERQE